MSNKQFISDVIKNDYETWIKGATYFIDAQTGSGKTYFIKNKLGAFAETLNRKILILTNRDGLKEQIKNDIGEVNHIDIINYQKIEALYLHNDICLDNYYYIVCDECQYFVADTFSVNTDLSLKTVLSTKAIKIFMTGTPHTIKYLFKQEGYEIEKEYITERDYNYLDNIINYSTDGQLRYILDNIQEDEQVVVFTGAKKGYEWAKDYGVSFICSKYNKDYNITKERKVIKINEETNKEYETTEKYIESTWDTEELDLIIKEQRFEKQFLFCTTCLDNGINLAENSKIKHIVIDNIGVGIDTFIQCLGRRRVAQGETINLYFYDYSKDGKRLNGYAKRFSDTLQIADYLKENGQQAYIEKQFKKYTYDQRIINVRNDKNGNAKYTINKALYYGLYSKRMLLSCLLDKKDKEGNKLIPIPYKEIIALNLGIDKNKIKKCEGSSELLDLEGQLEVLVGQPLYKDEQKQLAELIGLKDNKGRLLKSITSLNAYLDEIQLPFIIKSERKSYRENGKKKFYPTSWVIYELTC